MHVYLQRVVVILLVGLSAWRVLIAGYVFTTAIFKDSFNIRELLQCYNRWYTIVSYSFFQVIKLPLKLMVYVLPTVKFLSDDVVISRFSNSKFLLLFWVHRHRFY